MNSNSPPHNSNGTQNKPVEEYLKQADILLDKRFLFFAFNCLGKKVEVQLEDGTKSSGAFYTANIDNGGVILKNFASGNNDAFEEPLKILTRTNFVYLLAPNMEEPPLIGAKKELKTDADISKKTKVDQRKLVKWNAEDTADAQESSSGFSLEDMANEKGKWNQFEANQKKFGLKSEFEETMYTTALDMKKVSAALLEKATRIEAEILNSTSEFDSRHIKEERGLQGLKEENENEDEEFAYSSVIRTDSKTDKKGAAKVEEERKPKFFNSKKEESKPTPAAKKIGNKTASDTLGITKKESIPAASNKEPARTPKAGDDGLPPEHKGFITRQPSNLSEDSSNKSKSRLSLKAGTFDDPNDQKSKQEAKPKEEEKPKPPAIVKQASLEVDSGKKFDLSEYSSVAITKFKLKVEEKIIKRSSMPFFDYTIGNWQKKPGQSDPSLVNPTWKISKNSNTIIPPKPTATATTSQSNLKPSPMYKPNAAPYTGGMPGFDNRPNPGMMFPQPFGGPGFQGQPYSMPYQMPMQQNFKPGYPYPQNNYPPNFFVDPTQPSFNMSYPHNNANRQGQPRGSFSNKQNK